MLAKDDRSPELHRHPGQTRMPDPKPDASPTDWPRDVIAVLVLLAILLISFQYLSLDKFDFLRQDRR